MQIKLLSPITNYQLPITNAAFTLIELLISVGIITLLLGASFAGFARLNQRQTLISAGQNLKNIIRDAQNRAVNGEFDCTKCDCTGETETGFSGWYVDFTTKSIYGKCTAEKFGDKNFGLSSEVVITPYVTPAAQIIFINNPPSASGKATVCVGHSGLADNYYIIRVNESGSVSDDGGLVSSCVP